MPFCPKCKYEYMPGIKECPDCSVRLVDSLAEEQKPQWVDLVEIATFTYEPQAQMAKLKLQAQGIESVIINEKMAQSDMILVWADGGVKLLVNREDARKAVKVLESED